MSQRRSNRSTASIVDNPPDKDAVKECVRYIVCREGSKLPIKRADISNHLSTVCSTPANQVNKVIIEANNVLKKVYGYKIVQVEKNGVQHIVVLNEECESLQSTILNTKHRRMLVAALTHIFMNGAPVKEEDMWKFLSEAGVLEENDHAGRKVMINTFTRQMYLTHSKIGQGDMVRTVFDWGQRANEELPKMYVLNKMAEAFQKSPDYWSEQYKIATEGTET